MIGVITSVAMLCIIAIGIFNLSIGLQNLEDWYHFRKIDPSLERLLGDGIEAVGVGLLIIIFISVALRGYLQQIIQTW